MTGIAVRSVATLKDFYGLMSETLAVRRIAVAEILAGRVPSPGLAVSLKNARDSLAAVPVRDGQALMELGPGRPMLLDLSYEVGELKKDIFYLEKGEKAFLEYLAGIHEGFCGQVREGRIYLDGPSFNAFVTDRDGTVNNYCGRYLSSVQSAYNAVFLTRFARSRARFPVVLTSAPLRAPGVLDLCCAPEGAMIYAASKGREFVDLSGRRRSFPIDGARQARLDVLYERLEAMLASPDMEKFSLIGSGLQYKFGQITVARQDITGSVPPKESDAFLAEVAALMAAEDPDGEWFRIEDTGLDIEIILTIEAGDESGGLKDFDKGDGVRFLARDLGMNLDDGPHLVCGDTASDVPMLQAAVEASPDVRAVFVTRKEALAKRVRGLCPGALVVPEPDMLVTMLGAEFG